MKYKFKLKQKVYPISSKRIYRAGSTRHSQKWEGQVVGRYCKDQQNFYVVESETGFHLVREQKLTVNTEQVIAYVLVQDVGVFTVLTEKPEVIPNGAVLVSVSGVLHD